LEGVNGIIGYDETVIPGAAILERLGVTELQRKATVQLAQAVAKDKR
jgi:hypothetical protein